MRRRRGERERSSVRRGQLSCPLRAAGHLSSCACAIRPARRVGLASRARSLISHHHKTAARSMAQRPHPRPAPQVVGAPLVRRPLGPMRALVTGLALGVAAVSAAGFAWARREQQRDALARDAALATLAEVRTAVSTAARARAERPAAETKRCGWGCSDWRCSRQQVVWGGEEHDTRERDRESTLRCWHDDEGSR
jgi:hypothetical protein